MADVADIQTLMGRAEAAAHSGDFVAAEAALRLAVELQERTLGASSPEVASTLNNLGVVYERLDRPADAEACYRKSFAIARAAFGHDHPLVETSATNLREFCDARGLQFEVPEAAPRPTVTIDDFEETAPIPAPAAQRSVDGGSSSPRRPLVVGAIVGAALIALVIYLSRREPGPASQAPMPAPAPQAPAQVAPAPPSTPSAEPPAPVAATAPPPVTPPVSTPSVAPAPRPAPRPTVVEVVDARLCQSLDLASNWRCDPLADSTAGGAVFFVTRLKSAGEATVEHRWYRNDKLAQAVKLRVQATGSGYRTYSRTTTSADRAGTWRVELRDAAGAVLAEKTFVVGPS